MSDEPIFLEDGNDDFIRPFLVTGGRTRSSISLQMETMVQTSSMADLSQLRFEAANVIRLCRVALSVAEVSAHLKIPLGTTKVLVGDLIQQGHLRTFETVNASNGASVDLIHRLKAGVSAL